MFPRDDLWKGFRFGAIGFMADDAELCSIGQDGFLAGEVLRMTAERAVAGFASHVRVRAFAFGGDNVAMAVRAGFAARKHRRPGGDFIQRSGPEMSVFSEIAGDEGMTDREERNEHQDSNQGQTDQVSRALEHRLHS